MNYQIRKTQAGILLILLVVMALLPVSQARAATEISFLGAVFDEIGLDEASSVAVSPDGNHVYATGRADDTLTVFGRDGTTGALTLIEILQDGQGGVDGLRSPYSVAVSPDGEHVYVAGFSDKAIAVFSRDGTTGALTFVEVQKNGQNGVDGLDGISSVTVSPDGQHLYGASIWDDAVVVFSRNAVTGVLTFVEVEKDGQGGVDGLDRATEVAVSPDGQHVYVAGEDDDAVAVFSRDGLTGALTFVEMQQDGVGGVDGLNGVRAVTVSPDGEYLYAASGNDDALAVFSRDGLTGALTFVEMQQDGLGGVDGLGGANSIAVTPDKRYVYVASLSDYAVAVFKRELAGALTFVEMQQDGIGGVDGLDVAASVALSPDGQHLYVASIGDNVVTLFNRDLVTGALTFVEARQGSQNGLDSLDTVTSVALSPDGQHLYVASRGDDAVTVFSRDGTTGALTFVAVKRDQQDGINGLDGADAVAVSPDGQHIYAAGEDDDAVVVFSRDATTGVLTFVEMQQDGVGGVDGLNGAGGLALSPDGQHLYVAGRIDDAVAVFSRDETTGALTFVELQQDGVGGVDGLDYDTALVVSPDGQHLYVSGEFDNAVAVFSRDATTGALTFVEMQQDGLGGVDGLDWPKNVTISPDGQHLYVVSRGDDAVAVFSRDATTGALTFVEAHLDGLGGVDGLNGASGVAVSPDGQRLYVVSGFLDNSLVVFERDETTGALTFLEYQRDVNGVNGFRGGSSVTVSPDGRHLYVAGAFDDAVAIFGKKITVFLPLVIKN